MNHDFSDIEEESNIYKNFDFSIMKRLLKYSKPYTKLIIVCFIMLILSASADLARPYLMKIAIDDNISGYDTAMVITSSKPINIAYVEFNGKYYIRKKLLDKTIPSNYQQAQLLKDEGKYCLINGFINTENIEYKIITSNNKTYVITRNKEYEAQLINKSTYLKFTEQDKIGIKKIAFFYLIILIGSYIFTYAQIYILNYIGQKVVFNIRKDLFGHIEKLSLSFFDKTPVGKLVSRITNDVDNISEMFATVIVNSFKDILLIIGSIIIMLSINVNIAMVCVSTIPFVIMAAVLFRRKARVAHREVKVKMAKINSSLNENIMGMKVIQIFSREKHMYDEFNKINTDHNKSSMKELFVFAVFRPSMDLIYSITLSLLLWYGSKEVLKGVVEFGVLFAFINYLQQLFRPIFDLSEKFNVMQSAMASSEKIFKLQDTPIEILNSKIAYKLESIKGEIEFKNVWFAYDKDWILKDVSFKINPGETIAFVGSTGSGKTTIINLLCRFYDIQKEKY